MASRKLSDCVPLLQLRVPDIIQKYNASFSDGRVLQVLCTLRSTDEQFAIWQVGRTWVMQNGVPHALTVDSRKIHTWIDGYTKFSKHNPDPNEPLSKAVDFGVFVGGKYMDRDLTYYYPLLQLARDAGLVSGIDIHETGQPLEVLLADKRWHDCPHIEVSGPVYTPLSTGD